MKTFVNLANDLIKERNLEYSPKIFSEILEEVKRNPINIDNERKRLQILSSVKNNHKTDMFTAYGMNKRPY